MPTLVLDELQKKLLNKFKSNLSDVTEDHHDDYFFVRWLRARSWNLEAAEKMLRQSLRWRTDWEVDGALKTWKAPQLLEDHLSYGTTGFDKDGAPIIILVYSGLDVVGLVNTFDQKDILKYIVQILEKSLESAKDVYLTTVIIDMDQFSSKILLDKAALQLLVSGLQMYEANFPEILKVCLIINAPKVFTLVYNIAKKILNEHTIAKLQIFGHNPEDWKAPLFSVVDPDLIPAYYGGNLTDPDGNPKCITKIKPGGKILEKFYRKNGPPSHISKNFDFIEIKNRDKYELTFKITNERKQLKWEFYTKDADIGFSVVSTDEGGKTDVVIPNKRLSPIREEESGFLNCLPNTIYTVIFDNSYSVFKKKKLFYEVFVVEDLMPIAVNS